MLDNNILPDYLVLIKLHDQPIENNKDRWKRLIEDCIKSQENMIRRKTLDEMKSDDTHVT